MLDQRPHLRARAVAVCRQGDTYWLFVRDRQREGVQTPAPTVVYASSDPCCFDSSAEPLAIFPDLQAPEIVEDAGRLYVVRVSGVTHASMRGIDDHGWLEVAPLTLSDAIPDEERRP